ncbi:P22 coat - protein 5 family protein [Pseudomonas sp. SP16.1]|uniref:P22 coat - protein 5 family protein n=1 Tax=Pseudomonas sp. SP16.1 TaxID=3458854 RepID=UPI0040455A97
MANTLTNLIPDMYEALDVVSRELTGFIPAVSRSSDVARAALNQQVLVPVTTAASSADNTPGVTAPNTGDTTVDNVAVSITKSKHVPVRWNGEETKGLQNAGTFSTIQADRFYQAMRTLVNEIEADLWGEAYKNASRAFGAAGTTPFGTAADMTDFAGVLRILEENGAPTNDLQLALGHAAIGNLRGKQSGLFKVNEAGSDDMLRNGMTDRIMNMAIRHSHAIGVHTKGTGSGYVTSGATAVGATDVALITGTGTVLAGDVVTFAADGSNKYIVNTGVAAPGTISLGKPGARVLIPGANALTVGNSYTPNVAFARSAIVLATRAPALPEGGDAADDVMMITDPRTGLSFEVAVYRQFLQTVYHVRLAWGFRAIKPEHIGVLMG